MAKNIFEQIVSMVSNKWPEPEVHNERNNSGGLTGVERYLAKKTEQEKPQLTGVERYLAKQALSETETAEVTGVEKYLAKQTLSETETAEVTGVEKYLAKQVISETKTAPLTGVDRYFAKQTLTEKNSIKPTRVEKYLTKQLVTEKITEKASGVARYLAKHAVAEQIPVKLSGVARYLANQTNSVKKNLEADAKVSAVQAETSAKTIPAQEQVNIPKVADSPTQAEPTVKIENQQPTSINNNTPKVAETINLAENAIQCQASTSKGTQCSRNTNLTVLRRTINKQKYQFAVCSQHKKESFRPYKGLI